MVKAVTNFKKVINQQLAHCNMHCMSFTVTTPTQVSRTLETFNVEETATSHLTSSSPNVRVMHCIVQSVDSMTKVRLVCSSWTILLLMVHVLLLMVHYILLMALLLLLMVL